MKSFRYILLIVLFGVGSCSLALFTSCKNKCGTTTCQNGSTCSGNKCICPTGYSGNACQSGWSDVAIGTYHCSRSNCKPGVIGTNTWQSSITKSSTNGGFTIYISNFDNSNISVSAIIDSNIAGLSPITISPAAGSFGVSATGNYNSNTKIVNLHFTSGGTGGVSGYTCDMTMTKE